MGWWTSKEHEHPDYGLCFPPMTQGPCRFAPGDEIEWPCGYGRDAAGKRTFETGVVIRTAGTWAWCRMHCNGKVFGWDTTGAFIIGKRGELAERLKRIQASRPKEPPHRRKL